MSQKTKKLTAKAAFTLAESPQRGHVIACNAKENMSLRSGTVECSSQPNTCAISPCGVVTFDDGRSRNKCAMTCDGDGNDMRARKAAFTLAETLIALAVIGIVAALTIPSMVQSYKKKVVETRLKQSYSIFSAAVRMAEAEKGEVQNWDFSFGNVDFYNTYLKDYLKVNDTMFLSQLNGQPAWKELCGGEANSYLITKPDIYILKLSNGNLVFIASNIYDNFKILGIDINGFSKPNQIGKDFFYFMISRDFGFTPYGYGYDNSSKVKGIGEFAGKDFTRETLINGRDDIKDYALCKEGSVGQLCTLLIYTDGWKIKDDYPW